MLQLGFRVRFLSHWQDLRTFQHQGLNFRVRGLGLGLVLWLGLGFRVKHVNDAGTFRIISGS